MSILFILIPMAGLLAAGALGAFLWSVNQGQMDDLVTPALRMLNDEEPGKAREQETVAADKLEPPA